MAIQKHKQQSVLKQTLEEKKNKSVKEVKYKDNFKISFQYLDCTQVCCSKFSNLEESKLLAKTFDTLHGLCNRPLREQIDGKKFARYGNFPPADKTEYKHPDHVPQDAEWARIHVTGAAILAGHIVDDTFYIVFLDSQHRFYLTRRDTE